MARSSRHTRRRGSSVRRSVHKRTFWLWRLVAPKTFILLLLLIIGITASVVATLKPTELRKQAVSCSENGCKNVAWGGGYYMITNCTNCPAEPDGDQQVCNVAGRVGLCGGKEYCCPGPKKKWTTDMTACEGKVYVGPCTAPTATPNPTNTPQPTSVPTATPYPTYTPYPTATPTPQPTSTPRPTSRPRPTSTIRPTVTLTPTPVPLLSDVCGKSCVTDTDCQLGLMCSTVFATLRACRNRLCPDNPGCLCDDTSGSFFFATPTPGPGSQSLRALTLTVGSFADRKGQTNQTPTISGISEPDAKITITVYPDGIGGEVYADKNGKWSYKFTKKLSPGAKSMLIVATKPDGQAQVTKTFTVVGGGGGNVFGTILTIIILAAVAFGVYVYIKSNQ